ncbi:TetR/AcrR family transcriptional regulator C-terminal domain-containing protein [Streptomyces sp. NPDC096193]|uniref:TetR/AcrR family transcriptional regulator C-terminal domain-containing protein n=1 Tax=Streptomyces sp. NPDC096193 TaxID=3155821 RepID=UPI00332E1DCE
MCGEASGQQLCEGEASASPATAPPASPHPAPATSHDTGQSPARGAAREPLSRERIIESALRIIDDEGVEALSMRRIAAALGVQAMSLYNHVGGKADVLDGVTEYITTDMQITRHSRDSWEDGIRSVAHAFRRASLRHPRAGELVLTRQLNSPGVLPTIDCSLEVLLEHGFEEANAVHALRLLVAFQVGSLMREFHSPAFQGEDESGVREREELLAGSGFAAVARLAQKLAVIDHDAEFTFGLERLIDALRPYAPGRPADA